MQTLARSIALVLLAVGLGCGKNDGPQAVRAVGTVTDQKTVTVGGETVVVTLGRGRERVEVEFPPDAAARRIPVTVRTEEGVAKRGPSPAGAALHVATQNVRFEPPARMRQPVPPPPPGRHYVAVHAQPEADSWAQRAPARALAMTDDGRQTFEIEVTGSGLWALALVQDLVPDAGPPDAGAPDAVPDAPRDAAPDVARDTAADAAPDAAPDVAPDGAPDAAPDIAPDVASAPRAIPQVATLSPTSGTAGAAVTLTLTGVQFDPDAAVVFAGQRLATTREADGRLQAAVPAALTMQPGQHAVWVENGTGAGASRSNTLYFTVNPVPGAPQVVDYSPDNGVAGDKILIVGRDLMGDDLKVTDPAGLAATVGPTGTTPWWGGTLQTVEITLPPGWATGPITVSHARGSYRGKIFNVGRNLAQGPGVMLTASSEYGGTWTIARGADNNLVTSWFSRRGDCASRPTCNSIPWYQVGFATPTTVARIAMRGNREYESGYDFIRGKFELFGTGGAVLWSASYDLPPPDRDLDIVLQAPVPGVTAVRFTSQQDESDDPGFAELEVFGP